MLVQNVMSVILVIAIGQANKEFNQIQKRSARERISIAATFVSQVRVSLVVEHFVGR